MKIDDHRAKDGRAYHTDAANATSKLFKKRALSYEQAFELLLKYAIRGKLPKEERAKVTGLLRVAEEALEQEPTESGLNKYFASLVALLDQLLPKGSNDKQLTHAEHLINFTQPQNTLITISCFTSPENKHQKITAIQCEIPLMQKSEAIRDEYFKIFTPTPSQWFAHLAQWEQLFWMDHLRDIFIQSMEGKIQSSDDKTANLFSQMKEMLRHNSNLFYFMLSDFYDPQRVVRKQHIRPMLISDEAMAIYKQFHTHVGELALSAISTYCPSHPSVQRRYPALVNAWRHCNFTFDANDNIVDVTVRFRASTLSPNAIADAVARDLLAQQSIEQFIGVCSEENRGTAHADFTVVVQSLLTPLKLPPPLNYEHTTLTEKDTAVERLAANQAGHKAPRNVRLLTSNHPVNLHLGSMKAKLARYDSNQDVFTFIMRAMVTRLKKQHSKSVVKLKIDSKLTAIASDASQINDELIEALRQLRDQLPNSDAVRLLLSLLVNFLQLKQVALEPNKHANYHSNMNVSLHLAALEELLLIKLGHYVLSGCLSGKDRKAIQLITQDALMNYFHFWQKLPDMQDSHERKNYIRIFVAIFATGHHQRVSECNALGCVGLKSLGLILSKEIITVLNKKHKHILSHNKQVSNVNRLSLIDSATIKATYSMPGAMVDDDIDADISELVDLLATPEPDKAAVEIDTLSLYKQLNGGQLMQHLQSKNNSGLARPAGPVLPALPTAPAGEVTPDTDDGVTDKVVRAESRKKKFWRFAHLRRHADVNHSLSKSQFIILKNVLSKNSRADILTNVKDTIENKKSINTFKDGVDYTLLTFFLNDVAPRLIKGDEVLYLLNIFKKAGAEFDVCPAHMPPPIFYLPKIFVQFDLFLEDNNEVRRAILGLFNGCANVPYKGRPMLLYFLEEMRTYSAIKGDEMSLAQWKTLLVELTSKSVDLELLMRRGKDPMQLSNHLTGNFEDDVTAESLKPIRVMIQCGVEPFAGKQNLVHYLFNQWVSLRKARRENTADASIKTLRDGVLATLAEVMRVNNQLMEPGNSRHTKFKDFLLNNQETREILSGKYAGDFLNIVLQNLHGSKVKKSKPRITDSRRQIAALCAEAINHLGIARTDALLACFINYKAVPEVLCLTHHFDIPLYHEVLANSFPDDLLKRVNFLIQFEKYQAITVSLKAPSLHGALKTFTEIIENNNAEEYCAELEMIIETLKGEEKKPIVLKLADHFAALQDAGGVISLELLQRLRKLFFTLKHVDARNLTKAVAKLWEQLSFEAQNDDRYKEKIDKLIASAIKKHPRSDVTFAELDKQMIDEVVPAQLEWINSLPARHQFNINEANAETKYTLFTYFLSKYAFRKNKSKFNDIMQVFIEAGVNVNQCDLHQRLPLDYAIEQALERNYWWPVVRLISAGANLTHAVDRNDPSIQMPLERILTALENNEIKFDPAMVEIMQFACDKQYYPQHRARRISLLKSAFAKANNELIESLAGQLKRNIESSERARYSVIIDILIESRQPRALIEFAGDTDQLAEYAPKMSEAWGLHKPLIMRVIKGRLNQFFNPVTLKNIQALYENPAFDECGDIALDIIQIMLSAKNTRFEEECTSAQNEFISDVLIAIRKFIKAGEHAVVETFLSEMTHLAPKMTLTDINSCLKSINKCDVYRTSDGAIIKKVMMEIFSTEPDDHKSYVELFMKMNDIVFHHQVKGLTMPEVVAKIENNEGQPGFKLSECLAKIALTVDEIQAIHKIVEAKCEQFLKQDDFDFAAEAKHYSAAITGQDDVDNITSLQAVILCAIESNQHSAKKKPHNTQALAFLAMCMFSERGQRIDQNLLAEVKTGQGKSLILAMVAAYNVARGYIADIVTVNDTLAKRDLHDFSDFYKLLGQDAKFQSYLSQPGVNYTTVRHAAGCLANFQLGLFNGVDGQQLSPGDRRAILLVDEADTLFTDSATGVSNIVDTPVTDIEWIYKLIWEKGKNLSRREIDSYHSEIKSQRAYARLAPWKKEFIAHSIRGWVDSAIGARKPGKRWILRNGNQIGEMLSDGNVNYSSRPGNGFYQFLQLHFGLSLTPEILNTNFNEYEAFIKDYDCVVGVSGTIGSSHERVLLYKNFGIMTFDLPLFFDKTNQITEGAIIYANDKKDHFEKLAEKAIYYATKAGPQPVLIIVEDEAARRELDVTLRAHKSFHQDKPDIQAICHETDENGQLNRVIELATELTDRGDKKIARITVGTTLASRGLDFVTQNEIDDFGGMVVLLGYFPKSEREGTQAKGRTARQDHKGLYHHVLNNMESRKYLDNVAKMATDTGYAISKPYNDETLETLCRARENSLQMKSRAQNADRSRNNAMHTLCQQFFTDIQYTAKMPIKLKESWSYFLWRVIKTPLYQSAYTASDFSGCLKYFPQLDALPKKMRGNRLAVLSILYETFRANHFKDLTGQIDLTEVIVPAKPKRGAALSNLGTFAASSSGSGKKSKLSKKSSTGLIDPAKSSEDDDSATPPPPAMYANDDDSDSDSLEVKVLPDSDDEDRRVQPFDLY